MAKSTSNEKGYTPRGMYSESFMSKLPVFNSILEYSADPANELDVQFRGDYLNIYYIGGRLLKLSGTCSCTFDENYFYRPKENELRMTDIERLYSENYRIKKNESAALRLLSDSELECEREKAKAIIKEIRKKRDDLVNKLRNSPNSEVGNVIEEMKCVMREWKDNLYRIGIRKGTVSERVVQQYISLYNKESEANSDFFVLDIEYALSEHSDYCILKTEKNKVEDKQPRIDIVAIEKNTGQLYVMELKYGMKSVLGKASAKAHLNDFNLSVGAEQKWEYFWEDIQVLLEEKRKRGLVKSTELKHAKPVFAFVFKSEINGDIETFKKYLRENGLSTVPCVVLQKEPDYKNPRKEYHWLKISV